MDLFNMRNSRLRILSKTKSNIEPNKSTTDLHRFIPWTTGWVMMIICISPPTEMPVDLQTTNRADAWTVGFPDTREFSNGLFSLQIRTGGNSRRVISCIPFPVMLLVLAIVPSSRMPARAHTDTCLALHMATNPGTPKQRTSGVK